MQQLFADLERERERYKMGEMDAKGPDNEFSGARCNFYIFMNGVAHAWSHKKHLFIHTQHTTNPLAK